LIFTGNQLKLSANNAENAVHNTEKFTYLFREFYSWVFSYAYAVESHYVTVRLCSRRAWRCIDVYSTQRHLSVVVWGRVL